MNSYWHNWGTQKLYNPCVRNCPNRHVGCHSNCADYQKFKEKNEACKKKEYEEKSKIDDFLSFRIRRRG